MVLSDKEIKKLIAAEAEVSRKLLRQRGREIFHPDNRRGEVSAPCRTRDGLTLANLGTRASRHGL